ncbi:MAG TPA: hypothetical protein VGO63_00150 [Candidatus Paceibacterota bacterium]|jgi:hypothetical protein|nr:hypothetical protein [Candidatus Paceibacterota bacterium]
MRNKLFTASCLFIALLLTIFVPDWSGKRYAKKIADLSKDNDGLYVVIQEDEKLEVDLVAYTNGPRLLVEGNFYLKDNEGNLYQLYSSDVDMKTGWEGIEASFDKLVRASNKNQKVLLNYKENNSDHGGRFGFSADHLVAEFKKEE